ncbi:MAG: TonB-dependent receptor [Holophagales bacterium]|jgi:hypothetical protein|nr:TonB-dependent receptor [Holophagales bacterium]
MRKNLVFTSLVAALVSGGAAYSQDISTAVLAGRVTSRDGQPLPGVRVLIESPALLSVRQATTDANGQFRAPLLPNGEYTITYTLQGYITRKLSLRIIAGQTSNAGTSLTPISVQETTVEISGSSSSVAQVDKTDTVVQTSYSSDFLEKVVGRSYDSIAQLAPGLSNTNFGSTVANRIRGGSGYGNITLVNGASYKDMWNNTVQQNLPLQDLIESVAVIQSPLNSRYGNTDSGLLSVVTSKGTNQFSGSVRLYSGRNGGWGANDEYSYPRRDGTSTRNTAGGNDQLSKRYEITIKGPIWKDHITFAYGTNLQPSTTSESNRGSLFYDLGNGRRGRAQDQVGTFYYDPQNGNVIRKAELYLRNNPVSNPYQYSAKMTFNQFTVFGQITPSHQIEWNYSQRENNTLNQQTGANDNGWIQEDAGPWNVNGQAQRNWSVAYKGIIGSSGILEARMGNSLYEFYYVNGRSPVPRYPIMIRSIASRFPIDPNGDLKDYDNYYANGYVGPFAYSSVATNPNPFPGSYGSFHNSQLEDVGDAGGTKLFVINYQHMLNTNMGTHMVDLGVNSEKFSWSTNQQTPYRFYAAGQIAFDLSDVTGLAPVPGYTDPRAYYGGKYIVFNPTISKLSDVDPWGVAKYGITDRRFIDDAGNVANNWQSIIPRVNVRFGVSPAYVYSEALSYYVNDLWSINDHHSIMAGVRIDNLKVNDMVKEVLKYMQPTFRAEYKWDIHGDQSRLVSVSWGQFHNDPGAGTFRPALTVKNQNSTTWYWTGSALGDDRSNLAIPYLVTKEDILNLENYRKRDTPVETGAQNVLVDPNFKALISTEFSVGFRRTLKNGGYWKLSFVQRGWQNDFAVYPGEEFQDQDGMWDVWRIMKNAEGTERSYKSLEAEWDFPVNKRTHFGGSYTYARYMNNTDWMNDNAIHWQVLYYDLNMDSWWDEQFGGRNVWNPVRQSQPEHKFRTYLTFDLSSGRLDSSATLLFNYTSADFQGASASGYAMRVSMPANLYPHTMTPNGWTPSEGSNWAPWPDNVQWIPTNNMTTAQDSWNLDLRYMISVPLVNKVAWHARITVSNVFNHRGLGGWYPGGNAGVDIAPYDIWEPDGYIGTYKSNIYDTGYRNVWRPGGPTFDGNGLYQGRMGARSFSFETGLRF